MVSTKKKAAKIKKKTKRKKKKNLVKSKKRRTKIKNKAIRAKSSKKTKCSHEIHERLSVKNLDKEKQEESSSFLKDNLLLVFYCFKIKHI